MIWVEFGRAARDALVAGGVVVAYHESGGGHEIDRGTLGAASAWLAGEAISP